MKIEIHESVYERAEMRYGVSPTYIQHRVEKAWNSGVTVSIQEDAVAKDYNNMIWVFTLTDTTHCVLTNIL